MKTKQNLENLIKSQNQRLDRLCKKLDKEKSPILKKVYLQEFQFILGRYSGTRQEWTDYTSKMMKYIMER